MPDEPSFAVRAGLPEDYEAVATLQREIQAAHAGAWPEYFHAPSPETLSRETYEHWLADPNREILVAVVDGRVVGHTWLVFLQRPATGIRPAMHILEIDQLCVTYSHRRRGYGRRLLREIDARARSRGVDAIELSVWLFNDGAVAAYKKHGFVPTSQRMRRTLDPSS